jgi:omega-6 fatty acid desaturase (delta-12 desaturase)
MTDEQTFFSRGGRELHDAAQRFAKESRLKSWWFTASTFVLLAVVLTAAGVAPWWPVRLVLSIAGGLLFVRAFVLYHDFMHGAILRKSPIGKMLFYVYGLVALTPPQSWRYSHNFHHANVGKPIPVKKGEFTLLTSDVGAVPLMTTDMWRKASFWRRLHYRVSRHPLTILTAYITVFLFSICVLPLLKHPRKFWDGALSLLVHGGAMAALWLLGGFQMVFFVLLLPCAVAAAIGAYLFFAQHNFEGLHIVPQGEWTHFRAALESSSYMRLGPVMNWFTGNIGYHHVHHLNSLIPFYRLPEAMAAIKELQSPIVTTLRPRDISTCLRLSLWDVNSEQLITYRRFAAPEQPH